MELRQRFFYANVIRRVIDLKCEVKCERLCGQELLISQPCSRNSGEQNMSFIAHIQPRGQFDLVFFPFWLVGNGNCSRKTHSCPKLKPYGFRHYAFENAFLSCVSLNMDENSTFFLQKTAKCWEDNFLNPLGAQKWSDYFEVWDDLTLRNLPCYTRLRRVELCSKAPHGGWVYFFTL